MFLVVNIY